MPAHRKLRQEDQELEARFGYIMRPCHKMEGRGRDQKGKGGREQTHRLHHLQNQELRIDGV